LKTIGPSYAITLILIRPIAGKLADRFGEGKVIVPALAVTILALLILSLTQGFAGVFVSAVLYGIGFGSAHPALQAATLRLASPDRKGGLMHRLLPLSIWESDWVPFFLAGFPNIGAMRLSLSPVPFPWRFPCSFLPLSSDASWRHPPTHLNRPAGDAPRPFSMVDQFQIFMHNNFNKNFC
jgi:MFS family permease